MQGRREHLISRLVKTRERLARGDVMGEAGDEAEAALEWLLEGSDFLGQRVARQFGKRLTFGKVTKWLPEDEAEGDPPLYHAEHDDGDEEDLDEAEVRWSWEETGWGPVGWDMVWPDAAAVSGRLSGEH